MKAILIILIAIHGLIHLMGFIKEWNLAPVSQLSGVTLFTMTKNVAQLVGTFWLLSTIALLFAATVLLFNKEWWWIPAIAGVFVSQLLIIIYWKDAKWGTLINIIILLVSIISFCEWNFNKRIQKEVKQIFKESSPVNNAIITKEMLNGFPQPVQLWLVNCGIIGKEKVYSVRLKQKGLMRTKPEQTKWIETNAEQYFITNSPAFIWKVKMNMMPLVPVTGRDKFVAGKGQMTIKLFSLINVANDDGDKIDQGALQRYLAEICWFPSAALSPYIKWDAIDSTSAKATLTYKNMSGSVVFHFNEQGRLKSCTADRYKESGKNAALERWEVVITKYGVINGVKIPVNLEVTWKLKTGDFTWYKLDITEIDYNRAEMYNQESINICSAALCPI